MIFHEDGTETVRTNSVLFSQPDAVRKLAIMMMVNAAEGSIDMITDYPENYETKEDMEIVLGNVREMALECLEDHIADLRRSLESFLRSAKVDVKVRRLDYTKAGELSDISIDIDVA